MVTKEIRFFDFLSWNPGTNIKKNLFHSRTRLKLGSHSNISIELAKICCVKLPVSPRASDLVSWAEPNQNG
jgi:hypothetical protein